MKKTPQILLMLSALSLVLLTQCSQPSGALTQDAITAALESPKIAVTPHIPGWLLEPKYIFVLTDADRLKLKAITAQGQSRHVDFEYYYDDDAGNRGDATSKIFYLYASNAQCLGCRFAGKKQIFLDDMDLPEPATHELYTLLKPYYDKMVAAGTPTIKKSVPLQQDVGNIPSPDEPKAQPVPETAPEPAAAVPSAVPDAAEG